MECTYKTKRKFVCLDNVSKFLYCSICDDIFRNPIRLKTCGHTYCMDCILQWSKHNLNCPLCRENFTENDIKTDIIANDIINDLEIYCVNTWCPWKGKLIDFSGHLKKCYFNPNKIPEYIKEVLKGKNENNNEKSKEKKTNENGDDDNDDSGGDGENNEPHDNNLTSFNTKSSLRARLYNRNRELLNNVFSNSVAKVSQHKKESELLNIIKENNINI